MAKNAAGGHKAGKKNRKHKRCIESPSHKRYEAEGRQEKNKAKKIKRHLKRHPKDENTELRKVPDYKFQRSTPERQKELETERNWKRYLRN